MKKDISCGRKRGRGALVLGLLGFSVLLAGGAAIAVSLSRPEGKKVVMGVDRLTLAKVASAEGDLGRAEGLLRGILKDNPGAREAKLLLGDVLLGRGRLAEGRGIFSEVSKEDPASFEAMRGLGRAYQAERHPDLAAVYLTRAAQLRKDDPKIWKELALAEEAAGDPMAALSAIQESLRLDPQQEDLARLAGELALGKGAPDRHLGMPKAPGQDPFRSRRGDPSVGLPGPRPPDPTQLFPKPDGRAR